MDITNESLKSMKAKQLRKVIREAIEEVLNENTAIITTKTGTKSIPFENPEELNPLKKDSNVKSIEDTAGKKLKEMANVGKLFQLSPEADVSTLTGQKSRIAATMQGAGPISQANVAKELGYTKTTTKGETVGHQNPIDKNFREMIAAGFIEPAGTQIAQRFSNPTPEPGEEGDEEVGQRATEPEDLFMGSATNPLAMYFDDEPNADGSEDFNAEEEPTVGDIEPNDEFPSTPSTDKEKAADFTIDDSNARLIQSIINNYTTLKSRTKGSGEMGGLSGSDMMASLQSSKLAAELRFPQKMQQLIDKIKEQEPSVQKAILNSLITKFASVKLPSLAKAIAKELNLDAPIPTIKTPIETPEEEEEDTIDEAFNKEYEMRKLQYYAGIRK